MAGINEAWRSTCKILLGDEVGDLKNYPDYLQKYVQPVRIRESSLTGKPLAFGPEEYSEKSKFGSMEEIESLNKDPIDINDIKDLDSLLEIIRERAYYCGNSVLGNSEEIEGSTKCVNSQYVYKSYEVYDSKYIAYSSGLRYCENVFGSCMPGETKFSIKTFEIINSMRCMEVIAGHNSHDCFYSGNLDYCTNCMFSFNLRNKNFCIGNNQFSKEEYAKLKEKLIVEIRETLKTKRVLPSILELIGMSKSSRPKRVGTKAVEIKPPAQINDAFQATTMAIFGKRLNGILDYSAWLSKNNAYIIESASAFSGEPVYSPAIEFYEPIKEKFIGFEEALKADEPVITKKEIENGFGDVQENLKDVYITPEVIIGKNENMVKASAYANSMNCYYGAYFNQSKNCAYCFWPRQSESVFGSSKVFSSSFCLKCYDSVNLTRCFEVAESNNCSDCYFCYNCEGLANCMFCFNAKSLRYAIANVEVGREEYMRIKKIMVESIVKKIENYKKLGISIYNLNEARAEDK